MAANSSPSAIAKPVYGSRLPSMAKKSTWLVALMLGAVVAFAREAVPRFEDYPATGVFKDKPAVLDLKGNPKATLFRTHLRRENSKGPNFAGRYRFARWECGTSCNQFAIVDCKTGKAYFSEDLSYVSWAGWKDDKPGFEFQADSRLLILRGSRHPDDKTGTFYYEWKDNTLKLLRSDLKP